MKKFQAAYVPIGVGTFHMPSAEKAFEDSKALLRSIEPDIAVPDQMLLNTGLLSDYLDTLSPDLIILQNLTFANAAYASEVLHRFTCPILLWTLREPVIDGGRLRLNSLTGAFSAANAIKAFREEPFEYMYGAPDEEKVIRTAKTVIRAARLRHDMQDLRMASIGHTPEGFGFGRALDLDLLENFGVRLISVEARELIDAAKSYTDEECEEYLQDAMKRTRGLEKTPERNRLDFARLYRSYAEFVLKNKVQAISSRCWPDFFTSYGTPVCAVLAMMNDLGVAASCETDTYGALSMWMGTKLTDLPVFFGDPVSLNEEENTITFWHCGTAACSLAREDTGAEIGEHCNRHIGPTMEFGCKAAEHVTIFRIGRKQDGTFRFFLAEGKALDRPKQFFGTSVVVETEGNAETIIHEAVHEGWEPHYVVIFGQCADELEVLAHMLNMEVQRR